MASSGSMGLKALQLILRGIQIAFSLIILGIFSYYLATLSSNNMDIRDGVRAVEAVTALAAIYSTTLAMMLVCSAGCVPVVLSRLLDIAFAILFIYVAVENRSASGRCATEIVYTVYGSGSPNLVPPVSNPGLNAAPLPTYQRACHLMMVCLVSACLVIPFFLLSALLTFFTNRKPSHSLEPAYDDGSEPDIKPDPSHRAGGARSSGASRSTAPKPTVDPDLDQKFAQLGDAKTRQSGAPPRYSESS